MYVNESRVMRLPGFYHGERKPVIVECVRFHPDCRYAQEQISENMSPVKSAPVEHKKGTESGLNIVLHEYTFIQHCRAHAATLSEFERYAMISNFTPFEGGIVLIHRLSSEYSGCNKNETKKKSIIFWTATLTRCSAAP